MRNIRKAEYSVIRGRLKTTYGEEHRDEPQIKELNLIICKDCEVADYKKCRCCKVYQLTNKTFDAAVATYTLVFSIFLAISSKIFVNGWSGFS